MKETSSRPILSLLTFFVELYYFCRTYSKNKLYQPALTCSKLAIKTLEQDVKYVQS